MGASKALIVIDYTFDFVAAEGKLTCGEPGQRIDGYVTSLTQQFVDAGDPVVLAVDVHDEGDPHHPESRLFPPHNLRGTPGRALYGQLGTYVSQWPDGSYPGNVKWMDKTRYSAFAGTDLDIWLRARGVDEVHLVGVCTDICVLHTAVNAYNLNYRIVIHERGVASFNPAGHAYALTHFQNVLGASVIS